MGPAPTLRLLQEWRWTGRQPLCGGLGDQSLRMGVAPQVQVVALEVTQVIQDWSNSIQLVEGKDTYVRLHLQLPPGNSGPVVVSEAQLYGMAPDNSALPGSPIFPVNDGLTVSTTNAADPEVRGHFANTLNFRLPPEWLTGTINLQLGWWGA